MSNIWNKVLSEHVLSAIKQFDKEKPSFAPSKNTFLIVNSIEYPAKFIRGMAYKIATGKEIPSDDYSGGKQTAKFLNTLGFAVKYKGKVFEPGSGEISNPVKKNFSPE